MKTKKRSLRGRIAPLAIAGTTLISGFMPLISNAGVWAAPLSSRVDALSLMEGLVLTLAHVDTNTMLDVDATSDGGFIAGGPFYQQNVEVDDRYAEFAIGSSLVKYNADSEVEWTKKVSEIRVSNDAEIDELVNGSFSPIIKNGDQSLVLYPVMGEEALDFLCIERNEFISAYQNERDPETVTCPDLSVGLIYAIKQASDGGYAGLSGGFSSLSNFMTSIMNSGNRSSSLPFGIIEGLDSSLVKFDANGDKVWSAVITGEAVTDVLNRDYRNQGLITNNDEALIPPVALIKDLIPLSDGSYITSGVSVSIYGEMVDDPDDDYDGPILQAPKFIYSGVLEKINSEGNIVGVKTYANKVFSEEQLASFIDERVLRSEDLEGSRLLYNDEHPDGHFYCRYDYEDHSGDPDYLEYNGYYETEYYTECRENDYFFVRMSYLGDDEYSGDDPIRTEELLSFLQSFLAFGSVVLPTQATPTSDGGVVIAGAEINVGIDFNDILSGMIIKFDSALNQQWTYKVTGENRRFSAFRDVTETADGGFVAVGFATKVMPISSYVVKVDANGNEVWNKLWLDDETGAISSGAIGVTELTTGQIIVIGANFEDLDFNNIIELIVATGLRDADYIMNNIRFDDIVDFDGYILALNGITGEKLLSQASPRISSRVTRMSNGKLVVINMNTSGNQLGAPIQLIADATIIDLSDVLNNNGGTGDDYSDITVPNTGVSNEIAQVPLILGAITMAAPFVLKMMARARKRGKATSFNK